ncbi:hypothetical protein HPB50_026533 [Hyalomma asiaticum]|uniref:Uncharacterized protein n=1 Tax=Hyalomma asiaticum TaxID=266040 RepID=A0ACB7RSZ8_HYAAI|nr:hypothetical protein HPB50_026533 [Hyalomma asiaticum]
MLRKASVTTSAAITLGFCMYHTVDDSLKERGKTWGSLLPKMLLRLLAQAALVCYEGLMYITVSNVCEVFILYIMAQEVALCDCQRLVLKQRLDDSSASLIIETIRKNLSTIRMLKDRFNDIWTPAILASTMCFVWVHCITWYCLFTNEAKPKLLWLGLAYSGYNTLRFLDLAAISQQLSGEIQFLHDTIDPNGMHLNGAEFFCLDKGLLVLAKIECAYGEGTALESLQYVGILRCLNGLIKLLPAALKQVWLSAILPPVDLDECIRIADEPGVLVYPLLLDTRSDDGQKIVHLSDGNTVHLQKASVLHDTLTVYSTVKNKRIVQTRGHDSYEVMYGEDMIAEYTLNKFQSYVESRLSDFVGADAVMLITGMGSSHDQAAPVPNIPGNQGAYHCLWSDGYIMSYEIKDERQFAFSTCSQEQFVVFLRKDAAMIFARLRVAPEKTSTDETLVELSTGA